MKKNTQIVSCFLAIYVLSLPLFLALHTQTHVKLNPVDDAIDLNTELIHEDGDCLLCEFYFDQQLIAQDTLDLAFYEAIIGSNESLPKLVLASSLTSLHLRGPPQS